MKYLKPPPKNKLPSIKKISELRPEKQKKLKEKRRRNQGKSIQREGEVICI
jgi:hypothetical protein